MQKVAIVGAGRVGETTAQFLAEQETAREVVLIDVREDAPQGVALDIAQTAPFFHFLQGVQRAHSGRHKDQGEPGDG